MKRSEIASVAFGLSVGFIASVGIGNALATNLMNPWLLFLATDIIGIASPKKWLAPILGGLYGLLCFTGISAINAVLTGLPIDLCSYWICNLPNRCNFHAIWHKEGINFRFSCISI